MEERSKKMEEDFLTYVDSEVQRFDVEGRHSAQRISRNALRTFKQATKRKRLPLSELTPELMKTYEQWLLEQQKSRNTVSCYIRALRTAYNRRTRGTVQPVYGLFARVYTGTESKVKRAASPQTTKRLIEAQRRGEELPGPQDRALTWFVLMFMLRGIPFVDLAYLRKQDLRDGRLVYLRRKTGKEISVEVPAEAMDMITCLAAECPDSPYLLPILDPRTKEEGDDSRYQQYQRALRNLNRHLERLTVTLRLAVHLSSYTARHTWATLAYHSNTPIGIISKALGHSSIKVTEFYLKPFDNKEIDKTNKRVISLVKRSAEESMEGV